MHNMELFSLHHHVMSPLIQFNCSIKSMNGHQLAKPGIDRRNKPHLYACIPYKNIAWAQINARSYEICKDKTVNIKGGS